MRIFTILATLFAAASAFGQAVPPPLTPQDSGPTLPVTMKYIQDKLNDEGEVGYRLSSPGTTDNVYKMEISNATGDAQGCTLSWRLVSHFERGDDRSSSELSFRLSFRDVTKIVVESFAEAVQRTADFAVLPNFWSLQVVTSSRSVHKRTKTSDGTVTNTDEKEARLSFHGEEAAQRMAKAITHAVELCGGGDKDPFQ